MTEIDAQRGPGKWKRRLAISGAALFALLALALVAPGFIDWSGYREDIAAIAEEASGHPVDLAGEIRFRILPSPALGVSDVTIRNAEGGESPYLARIERLDLALKLLPLLKGEIAVRTLALTAPDIVLERYEDGGNNWPAQGAADAAGDAAPGGSGDLAIDGLTIRNGRLRYHDMAAGSDYQLEDITADLSAGSLKGPFGIDAAARMDGHAIRIALMSRKFRAGDRTPLTLDLGIDSAEASFKGWLRDQDDAPYPEVEGELSVKGDSLADLLQTVSAWSGSGFSPPPALAQAFSVSTRLRHKATLALEDIALRFAGSRLGGAAEFGYQPPMRLRADLRADQLLIDPWLGAPPDGGNEPLAALAPLLRPDLAIDIALAIDALRYRDAMASAARLELSKDADGPLVLETLRADLPGASSLSLSGAAEMRDGRPAFEGALSLASGSLRTLLGWFHIVTDYPDGMLTIFSLESPIRIHGPDIALPDYMLALDRMAATGALGYQQSSDGARTLRVAMALDRLDADAWLPPATKAPPPPEQQIDDFAISLSSLGRTRLVLDLGVMALQYAGGDYRDVSLSAALQAGGVDLAKLSLTDANAAKIDVAATVSLAAKPYDGRASFTLALPDPEKSLKAAGVELPLDPAPFGRLRLTGTAEGTIDRLAVAAALQSDAGTAGVRGEIHAPLADAIGPFGLDITADISSHCHLKPLFDCKPADGGSAPLAIALRLDGDLAALKLKADASALGGTLTMAGGLSGLQGDSPDYDLAVTLNHASALRLVKAFLPDYAPKGGDPGRVALDATLKKTGAKGAVALKTARFGPVSASGAAQFTVGGARPVIDAALEAGDLPLDALLPASASGVDAAQTTTGRRWSQEPLELEALKSVDGRVRLKAASLSLAPWRLDRPDLDLALKDGVLTIGKATAGLYGGALGLEGRIDTRSVPDMAFSLAVTDADLQPLIKAATGLETISGKGDLTSSVTARGESQFDLVSHLNGEAGIAARDGLIRGIDLAALSDRLSQTKSPAEIPGVFAASLGEGDTAFKAIDVQMTIKDGVIITAPVKAAVEAGRIDGQGRIDLPAWSIAANGRLSLDAHRNMPPLAVDIGGNLSNPKVAYDSEPLRLWIVERVGRTIIEKLKLPGSGLNLPDILGGRKQQEQEKEEPPPDPPRI